MSQRIFPATCGGCKWWKQPGGSRMAPKDREDVGECRALPPTPMPGGTPVWPLLRRDSWCGSYTPHS